ncbi:hypothetical protein EDD99_6490 [Streptomyces sp. 846.5]|nr:hypothetical protein [Streptomyces sp. 846.5]TDT98263.1 hypothetical protein EDD99_6490 [Streptomyces sp. 846.5]
MQQSLRAVATALSIATLGTAALIAAPAASASAASTVSAVSVSAPYVVRSPSGRVGLAVPVPAAAQDPFGGLICTTVHTTVNVKGYFNKKRTAWLRACARTTNYGQGVDVNLTADGTDVADSVDFDIENNYGFDAVGDRFVAGDSNGYHSWAINVPSATGYILYIWDATQNNYLDYGGLSFS